MTIEACLCFDTTGSMYPYLNETRSGLRQVVAGLQEKASKYGAKLKLGVIAHGDYCDKKSSYVIKFLPLHDASDQRQVQRVLDFVKEVGQTYGGDAPECYELALRKASTAMGWGKNSRRLMVMVGDDLPHEVGYSYGGYTNDIDWKAELAALAQKKVRIYAVQAGGGRDNGFWGRLAEETKGKRLSVKAMSTVPDIVVAAVVRELGERAFADYGRELRARGAMTGETAVIFQQIQTVTVTCSGSGGDLAKALAGMTGLRLCDSAAGGGGGGGGARPRAILDAAAACGAAGGGAAGGRGPLRIIEVDAAGKPLSQCKHGVKCVKFGCPFKHPKGRKKDCHYGKACSKKASCTFLHPKGS